MEADTEDGEDSEEEMEPVPKRLHLDEDEEDDHLHVRNLREKKSNEDDKTPLQLCLNYLHKILQRSEVISGSLSLSLLFHCNYYYGLLFYAPRYPESFRVLNIH